MLRRSDECEDCWLKTLLFLWPVPWLNRLGPKGAQGEKGEEGERGEKGKTGEPGTSVTSSEAVSATRRDSECSSISLVTDFGTMWWWKCQGNTVWDSKTFWNFLYVSFLRTFLSSRMAWTTRTSRSSWTTWTSGSFRHVALLYTNGIPKQIVI